MTTLTETWGLWLDAVDARAPVCADVRGRIDGLCERAEALAAPDPMLGQALDLVCLDRALDKRIGLGLVRRSDLELLQALLRKKQSAPESWASSF